MQLGLFCFCFKPLIQGYSIANMQKTSKRNENGCTAPLWSECELHNAHLLDNNFDFASKQIGGRKWTLFLFICWEIFVFGIFYVKTSKVQFNIATFRCWLHFWDCHDCKVPQTSQIWFLHYLSVLFIFILICTRNGLRDE